MLFLLLVFWALQFLYAEECASLQLTHLRRVPFRHAPGGQVVAAHLTHLLMFLHPLFRCPSCWQFVHLSVFALMYLWMFVVVLPIVIFVCVICFSIFSLFTLKRIIVEIRLPFCFLCSPSVSMFSFFSFASITCKRIWGGILFMQSQGLSSFLPARCMYRLLPNISFLYFSLLSIEFVCSCICGESSGVRTILPFFRC